MEKNSILVIAVLLILISTPITLAQELNSEYIPVPGMAKVRIKEGATAYFIRDEDGNVRWEINDSDIVAVHEHNPFGEPKDWSNVLEFELSGCDSDTELCNNVDTSTNSPVSKTGGLEFVDDSIHLAESLDYPESLWAFEDQYTGTEFKLAPEASPDIPYKPNTWKWLESLTPEQRQAEIDKGVYTHSIAEAFKIGYNLIFMSLYAKTATTPPQPTRGDLVRRGILGRTSQTQAAQTLSPKSSFQYQLLKQQLALEELGVPRSIAASFLEKQSVVIGATSKAALQKAAISGFSGGFTTLRIAPKGWRFIRYQPGEFNIATLKNGLTTGRWYNLYTGKKLSPTDALIMNALSKTPDSAFIIEAKGGEIIVGPRRIVPLPGQDPLYTGYEYRIFYPIDPNQITGPLPLPPD